MGILEKVKETTQHVAADLREGAAHMAADLKKGAAQLQSKVEQVQLRRKADEHAKDIGYLVVRERTQGAQVREEIDRLVQAIVDLERQIEEARAREEAQGEAGPEVTAATPAPATGPAATSEATPAPEPAAPSAEPAAPSAETAAPSAPAEGEGSGEATA